jgi:hypothetical protein
MNMENNNVCNGGDCGKCGCNHGDMHHGCCGWKKCRMIKKIIWIVIVIIAFCLGTQLGELKAMARYNNFGGRGMMWGYNGVPNILKDTTQGTIPTPKQ